MPSLSRAIIASAGSGKTQRLVEDALRNPGRRVLITTYTRENLREIERRLWRTAASIRHQVTTMTWLEFLLRDGVKPYQAYKTVTVNHIRAINFVTRRQQTPGLRRVSKSNFDRYYLDRNDDIYQDAIADLACLLDEKSGGKVIARISACYDAIYIDEMQDLAGYDLVFLERLLDAGVSLQLVCDPRQAVYSTNTASRYKQYRGSAVVNWIGREEHAGRLETEFLTTCYRCNQMICDFADALYADLPRTISQNDAVCADSGVYLIDPADLDTYRAIYAPQELRWNRATKVTTTNALNFGEVKGTSFDRVLIHATRPITEYVGTGAALKDEARAKFYVAVTRARHSAAIVPRRQLLQSGLQYWVPPM